MDSMLEFDLGPLTWVKGEIDNALEAAITELGGWNGEGETPLKSAAAYLHQVYGALQIVDLQGVSRVCAEAEGLLADMVAKPEMRQQSTAEVLIRAIRTLHAYLDGLMAGAPNAEVALMPVYAELAVARGSEPPPPSELFFPDIGARVRRAAAEQSLDDDARTRALRASRGKYQKGLLQLLQNRDVPMGLQLMGEAVAEVEALVPAGAQYTFWWAVGGLLEALKKGSIDTDIWTKRLCGHLDMQMRRMLEGSKQLAERLFRDVLYHLAQDKSGQGRAAEARTLFELDRYLPVAALETPVEDPVAIRQAELRDALNAALTDWLRAASGRRDGLEGVRAALQRAGDVVREDPLSPVLRDLLSAMSDVARGLDGVAGVTGNEALQVEMAVAILLAQHGNELGGGLPPTFAEQARLQSECLGLAADPDADLTGLASDPQLEEFARQARDKLLLVQVTQSIQGNLQQVEDILERFFRDPAARGDLPLVPGLMKQVEGEFNLLHLDVAADLVKASMGQFAVLAEPGREISPDELNWIADAISTLGLYVEVLRRGRNDPGALRALLAQPGLEARGESSVEDEIRASCDKLAELAMGLPTAADPVAGRTEIRAELTRLARDADLVGDRALRGLVDAASQALDAGVSDQELQALLAALTGKTLPGVAAKEGGIRVAASVEEIDAELLQIYLEEAAEVLANIDTSLGQLNADPLQRDALVAIRRGFHTLKGSGRMVGLQGPAEIAWEVEQTLNEWLREERSVEARLLGFIGHAAEAFKAWVGDLSERGSVQAEGGDLVAEARQLRAGAVAPTETPVPTTEAVAMATAPAEASEETVMVGRHSLPAQLFRIFADEAAERLTDLSVHLQDLARGPEPAAWDGFVRAAHTLAGIARTTGFSPLAEAAHAIETWGEARRVAGVELATSTIQTLVQALSRLSGMLEGIRAGVFPEDFAELPVWLSEAAEPAAPQEAQLEPESAFPLETPESLAVAAASASISAGPADELDADLLPIFLAEAEDLLPRIVTSLRQWRDMPDSAEPRQGLQRALHTLKGSARMAGAMRLGEAAHQLETRIIEQSEGQVGEAFLAELEQACDHLAASVDQLKSPVQLAAVSEPSVPALAEAAAVPQPGRPRPTLKASPELLDTLINEAGEVSIARSRLENVIFHYKMTAQELTANVERLRSQLRELEMQAETQMHSRLASMDEAQFDPLEIDRFSRLQELTRLMAESVNDVSTAQENLLAGLGEAEEALVHQGRMTRSLQQQLMHIRMVPLNSQAERLQRIVRQAGAELGRQAQLTIEGGQAEVDRTVLDKVLAPLEHLLRNAVAHGIEDAAARVAAGKPEQGQIRLVASQEGDEFVIVLEDDGNGIDLDRVRLRAKALGWLKEGEIASRDRLESFLFMPGFSTAEQVTQVAGRGVGLDVVRSEIAGIGGRVRMDTELGRGTRFTLRLPISLALTQAALAMVGNRPYALPANTVVLVKEVKAEEWQAISAAGQVELEGQVYPLRSLAELTGQSTAPSEGKFRTVLLLRSGNERLALRVDRLAGNLEAVVKPIGPQLSRIVGIAGVTLLGDGRVALILDPFVLMERVPAQAAEAEVAESASRPPLIMVVDDSLTVRKITGRLLHKAGYRVVTAKDGAEALEVLQEEVPAAMLLDIEMPRMDGFEVARHVRADAQTHELPIIMITSRSAEKHRQHALDLGVDTYMGKPYQDAELLAEIGRLIGTKGNA
jgi:chemosensory pili system protein ChpA (sensor histidine kinase/response regulator)